MAIKDLALFKLAGSALKKVKDKVADISEKKLYTNDSTKTDESVQETFRAMFGKTEDTDVAVTEKAEIVTKKYNDDVKKKVSSKAVDTKPSSKSRAKVEKEAASLNTASAKKRVTKKVTSSDTKTTKAKPAKKETTLTKREKKINLYTKDIEKHLGSVDASFLAIIVKNLGPSIYRKDAELVSCSNPKELETVRKNFLIKKLGFDKSENDMLDAEIAKVCETLKGVRTKYRATFYYMLAKNLKKESVLS